MATVKGDVHDIGKNIVGVVLQCNNYEVIDLGVMVPAQKILDTASEVGADADRAVRPDHPVARRDGQRRLARCSARASTIPLLIGGATTSRAHTAVKVDGKYDGPVVWVKDASRSVPTARRAAQRRPARRSCWPTSRPTTTRCATGTRPSTTGRWSTLEQARANRDADRLDGYQPPGAGARRPGVARALDDYDLAELRDYIDWQPFFNAWEMKGKFPDILNNPTTGETARKLYDDAQEMLDRIDRGEVADRQRGLRVLPGQRGRRRHRGLHRRLAHRGAHDAAPPAPAGRAPRRRPEPVARPTSSRPRETGLRRPRRRVRGHRRPRRPGADQGVQGRARRLLRDPARVAGRPAGRGVRRAAAPAGAHRVLGPRRATSSSPTRT